MAQNIHGYRKQRGFTVPQVSFLTTAKNIYLSNSQVRLLVENSSSPKLTAKLLPYLDGTLLGEILSDFLFGLEIISLNLPSRGNVFWTSLYKWQHPYTKKIKFVLKFKKLHSSSISILDLKIL